MAIKEIIARVMVLNPIGVEVTLSSITPTAIPVITPLSSPENIIIHTKSANADIGFAFIILIPFPA